MEIIKKGGLEYRKITDDELLERMNRSLSGKHYTNEEAWKIIYQARKWGCKNLEEYYEKQKTFSESNDENTMD